MKNDELNEKLFKAFDAAKKKGLPEGVQFIESLTKPCPYCEAQSSKPEWPSLEDVELHLAGNTQYYLGVQDCYRFLKQRMNQNEKGAV